MDYQTRSIFVDESGDTDMYDKKGRALPDVSKLFMIGLTIINDPDEVRHKLYNLRQSFLSNPYFKGVPSFQKHKRKTAIMLHAKNDIPEVRWRVYELLATIPAKTTVVIRRKAHIMADVQKLFQETGKKLTDDVMYDNVVMSLFKYINHNNGDYSVKFAIKTKPRNASLHTAIQDAQSALQKKGSRVSSNIHVDSAYSHEDECLQLIDYYLWAIHRLFINNEDRYINMIRHNLNVILDMDDMRNRPWGELYTRHNPIELKK